MATDSAWPARVGVVGVGAMGAAFAGGLARAGRAVMVADARADVVERVATAPGISADSTAQVGSCDLVCIAVKPDDATGLLMELAEIGGDGVVLSMMAGWTLDRLQRVLPGRGLVRAMPNLAVRDGAGLVAVATRGLDDAQEQALLAVLAPLGTVVPLPEESFAVATALAGSGPGFIALIAEALEDGAVAAGLSRAQARGMVPAVLAGSAALLAGGDDPADLRQRVSSPGGTTMAGLAVLERGAVRAHVADAVRAAAARAREL